MPDIDWENLFTRMGFNSISVEKGAEIVSNCIFCGDKKRNFQANYKKKIFHCWSCHVSGKLVTLVKNQLEISHEMAVRYVGGIQTLDEDVGELLDEVRGLLKKPKHKTIFANYENGDFYWEKRGLSIRTIRRFGLGYDPIIQRATIPVIQNGRIVAVLGRAVNGVDKPSYLKLLPESHWAKNMCLFGIDFVLNKYKEVFIVEGALDCMKCYEIGIPNAVALLGSQLSKWQQDVIVNGFTRVVIMMDNDQAGERAIYGYWKNNGEFVEGIADRLFGLTRVSLCEYETRDPGELVSIDQIESIHSYIPQLVS